MGIVSYRVYLNRPLHKNSVDLVGTRKMNKYRLELGLTVCATNVDCHWHPTLGEHGMWYIH